MLSAGDKSCRWQVKLWTLEVRCTKLRFALYTSVQRLCIVLSLHLYASGCFTAFLKSKWANYATMKYFKILNDEMAVVRPKGVYLFDFFCSGIQFNVLLSPYL